jgi:ABC-type phosphate/phosphonate transport system substrate-binding protein
VVRGVLVRCGVVLVVAIVLAACGSSESEETAPASPESVLACVEDAGLKGSLRSIEGDQTVGGTVTHLIVDVSRNEGVTVSFFSEPDNAQSYVELENQAAATGLNANETELFDPTTAVRAAGDVEAEREIVVGCL